jgi:hypothetical protein
MAVIALPKSKRNAPPAPPRNLCAFSSTVLATLEESNGGHPLVNGKWHFKSHSTLTTLLPVI